MSLSRVRLDAVCRQCLRVVAFGLFVSVASVGSASAQAAPQAPALGFTAKAGMLLNTIKADKTAQFEALMQQVKEALAKSENPVRKQQAASWKIYKAVEPGAGGNVLYVFFMDPAIPETEYDPSRLFNEAFPDKTQEFFNQLKESFVSLNKVNLNLVLDMK
ncbi:MAG: hypothetical protein U0Q12_26270 [Vicinamibacterales bacterium]